MVVNISPLKNKTFAPSCNILYVQPQASPKPCQCNILWFDVHHSLGECLAQVCTPQRTQVQQTMPSMPRKPYVHSCWDTSAQIHEGGCNYRTNTAWAPSGWRQSRQQPPGLTAFTKKFPSANNLLHSSFPYKDASHAWVLTFYGNSTNSTPPSASIQS